MTFCKTFQGGGAELAIAALRTVGIRKTDIVETVVKGKSRLSLFSKSKTEAQRRYQKILGLRLRGVRVRLTEMDVMAWRDRWKKDFKTFRLTNRFDIVPSWERRGKSRSPRTPIYLDTGIAFGTGLHETTRFMVELIERCAGTFESFVDIGTGTGILTIAASHCGAQRVDAVDIDGDAVDVARQNLRVNRVNPGRIFVANIEKFSSARKYDFVAANLIARDLMQFKRKILSCVNAGGYLAVSGISLENYRVFRRAFASLPLRCLRVLKGKEWAAVLFVRR